MASQGWERCDTKLKCAMVFGNFLHLKGVCGGGFVWIFDGGSDASRDISRIPGSRSTARFETAM